MVQQRGAGAAAPPRLGAAAAGMASEQSASRVCSRGCALCKPLRFAHRLRANSAYLNGVVACERRCGQGRAVNMLMAWNSPKIGPAQQAGWWRPVPPAPNLPHPSSSWCGWGVLACMQGNPSATPTFNLARQWQEWNWSDQTPLVSW